MEIINTVGIRYYIYEAGEIERQKKGGEGVGEGRRGAKVLSNESYLS